MAGILVDVGLGAGIVAKRRVAGDTDATATDPARAAGIWPLTGQNTDSDLR
jgi:hypothetical protein